MTTTAAPTTKKPENESVVVPEEHVVLRLPEEDADHLRTLMAGSDADLEDKLQIKFGSDFRRADLKLENTELTGILVDLPCIIESQKTLDKKNFYKAADISQMLVCKLKTSEDEPPEFAKIEEKRYQWNRGLAAPLKNVRKRRFRKTLRKKYLDAPDIEKELKRLLSADLEAVSVRWELVSEQTPPSGKGKTQTPSSLPSPAKSEQAASAAGLNADDLFGSSASETDSDDEAGTANENDESNLN